MIVPLLLLILAERTLADELSETKIVVAEQRVLKDKSKDACHVCKCSKDGTYGVNVYCNGYGLGFFPENIPLNTTTLHLWANSISSIPEGAFTPLTELSWVNLGYNYFTLSPHMFDTNTKLKVTNFAYLPLTSIPPHLFDFNIQFESFAFYGSPKLSSIPLGLLDHLSNLKYIRFSDLGLTSIPPQLFKNLKKLEHLLLNGNPLICTCSLYLTMVDVTQYLNKNILGTCDGHVELHTMTPGNRSTFCVDACHVCSCKKDFSYDGIYIDCRNRHLTKIPDIFPETTTTLNLFHNKINTINSNDFQKLKKLKYLNLSRNKLTSISRATFVSLAQLERLSMADNQLTKIEPQSFDSMENLKEIELYGNDLRSFPEYLFENQLNLEHMDVSDNNLECNCTLYHVLVKVVRKLGERVSGTCNGDVKLSTITRKNKDKFCRGQMLTGRINQEERDECHQMNTEES